MADAGGHKERDAQIAQAYARGFPTRVLADTYGLTERHIRRILKDQRRQNAAPTDATASERLSDLLEMHESVIEDAALEAISADSSSKKLSALELKLRALDKMKRLMDEFGLLPHSEPPTWDGTYRLTLALTKLLRKHDAPKELQDELIEFLVRWWDGSNARHRSPAAESPS